MRIDTNNELTRVAKAQAPTPPRKPAIAPDMLDMARVDALDAALEATSEVRVEQVARAKALIRDPGYPSEKVVNQMAEVLSRKL